MGALSTPAAIIVAALIVSIALLFSDRYQVVRDRDFYAWKIDRLTGTLWYCGSTNSCREAGPLK
jgi:hypothetical protein